MRESELKQLVSSIRAPLMIADRYGASLAENSAWGSARQLLGNKTALRDLAQKAAGERKGADPDVQRADCSRCPLRRGMGGASDPGGELPEAP